MRTLTRRAPDSHEGSSPAAQDPSSAADDLRWSSRFVLVAVVLTAGCASILLSHVDDDPADARTTDHCVVAATVRATAFAAVLGDTRPLSPVFAERACRAG